MRLPIGHRKHTLSHAGWDRWFERLHTTFVEKFDTGVFERNLLINLVCMYRAFSIGPRYIRVNSDFYITFTHGFLEIARGAMGRCVKRDLALYIADMQVLVPRVSSLAHHRHPVHLLITYTCSLPSRKLR